MKASDYIVNFLADKGITDVFGLPGGVVLEFLYAIDRKKDVITAHLSYHEQCAAFAACGYAQAKGKAGVAYATRGPGITNMITAIADAYCDSIPVIFITGHSSKRTQTQMRIEQDQELDIVSMVSHITKYAVRIDNAKDVCQELEKAYYLATSGRKGPVLLDFASKVLAEDIELQEASGLVLPVCRQDAPAEIAAYLKESLRAARRPVILIGDGIRQSNTVLEMRKIAEQLKIPVLSSRFSQDAMAGSEMYFGYIGSHAIRYSNFILSKTDLIIAVGNRMSFPVSSKSFGSIMDHAHVIRIDIDETEFCRQIPNSITFTADLAELLPWLASEESAVGEDICMERDEWLSVCIKLRETLWNADLNFPVNAIGRILSTISSETIVVSDVGNNEFWLSRAYTHSKACNQVLYSKSFGALGCALGKAIGAYYAVKKPILCFAGDQGFQLNIQELQFIADQKLPIMIVLLNNFSSGMIRSREKQRYDSHFLHTTRDSGYSIPDFEAVAKAYHMEYYRYTELESDLFSDLQGQLDKPCVLEISFDDTVDLEPNLPQGNPCQKLVPELDKDIYEALDKL